MITCSRLRALYCCLVLLLWISVIFVGIYRYLILDAEDAIKLRNAGYRNVNSVTSAESQNDQYFYSKLYEDFRGWCNTLEYISIGDEKVTSSEFGLRGVLILFRHGDRGPLNHVRSMYKISCNTTTDSFKDINLLYSQYRSFLSLYAINQQNSYFQFINSYSPYFHLHGKKLCEIGQLTPVGAQQLLKLGNLLGPVYYSRIFGNKSLTSGDIVVYSTRYKRTAFSAGAFLYSFMPEAELSKLKFQDVYSLYYCFDDCACPAAEFYRKVFSDENSRRLKSHPSILKLVKQIASVIFTSAEQNVLKDPYCLKDGLMTYVCHNYKLPCHGSKCVRLEDVYSIFKYIRWDTSQYHKQSNLKRYSILKSYGLFKNIVLHLLNIISGNKPSMVIYSAHDKNLQYLLTMFGILAKEAIYPRYASRIIIEVYHHSAELSNGHSPSAKQYFFRLLYNGKDITDKISFCKKVVKNVPSNSIKPKMTVCPVESIIRFLHDDYFLIFNVSNFKDACDNTYLV